MPAHGPNMIPAWLRLTRAQYQEYQHYCAMDGKSVIQDLTEHIVNYIHEWREHMKHPDEGKENDPAWIVRELRRFDSRDVAPAMRLLMIAAADAIEGKEESRATPKD